MDRIIQLISFLKENPADPFLRHALAMEYIRTNQDREARPLLEANLSIDPPYTGSFYHYGKLLERSGEKELALETYLRGMQATSGAGDQHANHELKSAWAALAEA
jgi:Tfp pilus assembly protein PilF